MSRTKGREFKTDAAIEQDDKNRTHERKQKNLDSIANVSRIAIYVIPIFVLIWIILMVYHYITTNNWDVIANAGKAVIIYLGGYITRYLQTIGIRNEKE